MVLLVGETDLRTDWLERTQGNDMERVCHQLCDNEYRARRGGYLILRMQRVLPFNPNGIDNMESTLSFSTIISFMTNTNLQHYSGESGLSYMAQMAVITMMMFTSAATGLCVAIAFIRAVTSKGTTVGNF